MSYFKPGLTKKELTEEYRRLAKLYHPDVCKDVNATEIMAEINAEYDECYKQMHYIETKEHPDWYRSRYKSRRLDIRLGLFEYSENYQAYVLNTYNHYYANITYPDFNGGFALYVPTNSLHGLELLDIPLTCPTYAEMYFSIDGVETTSLVSTNQPTKSAWVVDWLDYRRVEYAKDKFIWVHGVTDCTAYLANNGVVTSCPVKFNRQWKIHEMCKGTDFGFKAFFGMSRLEFESSFDVDFNPPFMSEMGMIKTPMSDLYWIDNPMIWHFTRLGIIQFYHSKKNFRVRIGTFVRKTLQVHLHDISIDELDEIQSFFDDLYSDYMDTVRSMCKKRKIFFKI